MPRRKSKFRRLIRNKIPFGTNRLKSKFMHKQRSLYKKIHKNKDNTIDFWYNDTLYGRVDEVGNAIYPINSYLKQFNTDTRGQGEVVVAFNFVVDAYSEFVADFEAQHLEVPSFDKERYLKPGGLAAKKGWENVLTFHHSQVDLIYETFFGQYLQNNLSRSQRITSFDTFINVFLEFLKLVGTKSPITRVGLITSLYCTPNISGLCVEFLTEDHSVDFNKHVDIFRSRFYRSYKETAKKYGFLIDKNAPWRLVANVNSPRMQTFMDRYGITADNFFEKYYVKAHTYDIPTLRIYLKQYYESFIASQPSIRFPDETRANRAPLSRAEFNSKYDTNYWLWLYAKIRQTEVVDKLNDTEFNEIVDEAKKIKKYLDIHRAVRYINRKFLGVLEPPFKK